MLNHGWTQINTDDLSVPLRFEGVGWVFSALLRALCGKRVYFVRKFRLKFFAFYQRLSVCIRGSGVLFQRIDPGVFVHVDQSYPGITVHEFNEGGMVGIGE